MSGLRTIVKKPIIGCSDDRPTTTKNRFYNNKTTPGKSRFRRIGQASPNGLYPIFRGSKARECGSSCEREWCPTFNNLYNSGRNGQSILDGQITYFVRNNSYITKILIFRTFTLDNILNIRTLSPRNSKREGRMLTTALTKVIKNPIIEKADVLEEATISRSDYSQVGRMSRLGRVGQTSSHELYSRVCGREAWQSSLTCKRERNRSCCDYTPAQRNPRSVVRENFKTLKNRSKDNKKLVKLLDNTNKLLVFFTRDNSNIDFEGRRV